jgi:DNA mismatch endonuclease (patch repair protein)
MSRVRGKDTKPELAVRRLIHSLGYRYRLHHPRIPGHPDLVFPSRRKAVFVHGCFWHRHQSCKNGSRVPKSRLDFWLPKLEANAARDKATLNRLEQMGWEVLVVWECEVVDSAQLRVTIVQFMEHVNAIS